MKNIFRTISVFICIALMFAFTISVNAYDIPYGTYDIIGSDDRVTIPSTTSAPYSGIVKIVVAYDCSECPNAQGTGFFVDDNCILTAAHVYKCDHHNDASRMTIKAKKSSSGSYSISKTYSTSSITAYINSNYTDSTITSHDYCILILPDNLGSSCYKFKLGLLSDTEISNKAVTISGYIGDTMYQATNMTYDQTATKVYYYVDANDGQSGAPVYYQNSSGDYIVIAIHIRGGVTYNLGRRMTQALFNELASFGIDV